MGKMIRNSNISTGKLKSPFYVGVLVTQMGELEIYAISRRVGTYG